MSEAPPIPERPKMPARPERRVIQQEWKHAEALEEAKGRGLIEVRGYEQIRSHGTSAEGDISSVRTDTRTFSNATVIHFTDVGYRPRDGTAQAYSVYSRYSDLGYEGSGGETEVPSCRLSTGQRQSGLESPVGSVLEFEKFDGNTKEDGVLRQKQNPNPTSNQEFQPEIPQRPIRVSGPLYEIGDASVIRSANAASGEQLHSAASEYRKEIKLVPPGPDAHIEDILGEQYSSKGSDFGDGCKEEGTTNMKPIEVSGIDLELGTIPNSPTEELNKLLSLALKDSSKDKLAGNEDAVKVGAELDAAGAIPDTSLYDGGGALNDWLGRENSEAKQLDIKGKYTNSSINCDTDIADLDFPVAVANLGEDGIDNALVGGGIIPAIQLDASDSEDILKPADPAVATLDPSSASQHVDKATILETTGDCIPESTLDPTVSQTKKTEPARNSSRKASDSESMLAHYINEAEQPAHQLVESLGAPNSGSSPTKDDAGTQPTEKDKYSSPDLKHDSIPILASQKEAASSDPGVDTSSSSHIETHEGKTNLSPASRSPVRAGVQQPLSKAALSKKDDSDKGTNNMNGQEKPKRVPIVPKKPSSRIAAFQELLQRQQADQYSNKPFEDQHSSSSPTRFGGNRANFAQNLNGLFALPGMAPANLPPALAKKLAPSSPSEGSGNEAKPKVSTEEAAVRTSDIRTGRAKGPRGRKLPASVANIEKVTPISNNQIVTLNTWSVVFKPSVSDATDRSVPEESATSQEPAELSDSSKEGASDENILQVQDSNSTSINALASDPEILDCITSDL